MAGIDASEVTFAAGMRGMVSLSGRRPVDALAYKTMRVFRFALVANSAIALRNLPIRPRNALVVFCCDRRLYERDNIAFVRHWR